MFFRDDDGPEHTVEGLLSRAQSNADAAYQQRNDTKLAQVHATLAQAYATMALARATTKKK